MARRAACASYIFISNLLKPTLPEVEMIPCSAVPKGNMILFYHPEDVPGLKETSVWDAMFKRLSQLLLVTGTAAIVCTGTAFCYAVVKDHHEKWLKRKQERKENNKLKALQRRKENLG
ncbi:phospholipid-transporting ATPase 1-like protein [Corchorus olitorius]|uniref:Phospholipid-transporting ATPase 1-like protein n=1 Tax=Corchorus olitorius TaxID=93759 RepID=A0A1R3J8M5_9ROSI|nr:phospholipid-transporting ATPase 1-like protein [Corchorus olitorius]